MESTAEERMMPGAFGSNDDLPDGNWTAPPAMPALSPPRSGVKRYSPVEMPLRPEIPTRPMMPAHSEIPSISRLRAMPKRYPQLEEHSLDQEEGFNAQMEQSYQRWERSREEVEQLRQHEEVLRKREEEAFRRQEQLSRAEEGRLSRQDEKQFRQHDEAFRRHDEVLRQKDERFRTQDEALSHQDDEISRRFDETPKDDAAYTSQEMAPMPLMRTMPGSFDGADDYSHHFTSPPEFPSRSRQDFNDAPYRGNLHVLDPSSHYSRVLNGQIGNTPEVTVRRAPSTRISQNVGLASVTLRRNPSRRENLEMSANLAGKWPTVDIDPYMAYEVVRASPAPPRTPKTRTPNLGSPAKTSTPRSVTPLTAPSPATQNGVTPKGASKTPMKKTAPTPSHDAEHKAHIDKLAFLEASKKYWSQTGSKYDVKYEVLSPAIQSQLMHSTPLGTGGFGTVERVLISGVPIARKNLRAFSDDVLAAIRREVDAVRSLAGHHHIVQLVGTYLTTGHGHGMFHMLTFPVADCDLDTFLRNYEDSLSPTCDIAIKSKLSTAAGLQASASRYTPLSAQLSSFLKGTLGCITSAMLFMRRAHISHDDIKPANILLRAGQIYITDFGISRDRRLATQTSTEFFPGLTHGWSAPEKGDRHNPFQADVYSLGCIFMHVLSLLSGKKTMKDCSEILQSPAGYREAFIAEHFDALELKGWGSAMMEETWKGLSALTMEMIKNDRTLRPTISEVNEKLLAIGGERKVFHGVCCHAPPNQPALQVAKTSVTNRTPATPSTPTSRHPTTPSKQTPRQSTPPPASRNTQTTTQQTNRKQAAADDDNSVTITPATASAAQPREPFTVFLESLHSDPQIPRHTEGHDSLPNPGGLSSRDYEDRERDAMQYLDEVGYDGRQPEHTRQMLEKLEHQSNVDEDDLRALKYQDGRHLRDEMLQKNQSNYEDVERAALEPKDVVPRESRWASGMLEDLQKKEEKRALRSRAIEQPTVKVEMPADADGEMV